MKHKLLAHNEELNVSLIELQNNRNKWNAIRAYCALRLLAPILGDNIYGSCTKTINGVKIAVDPSSPAANMQLVRKLLKTVTVYLDVLFLLL